MAGKKKLKKRLVHNIRQKFPKKMQKKLVFLFLLTILAFVLLVANLIRINYSDGERYTKIVLNRQQHDSRTIPFRRGDIVDVNGTKLATSERVYNVILDAKVLLAEKNKEKKKKDTEVTLSALEECFGIKKETVEKVLKENKNGRYNVLKKKAGYAEQQAFEKWKADREEEIRKKKEAIRKEKEEQKNQQNSVEEEIFGTVNGVWLEEDYVRIYPYKTLASDLIGFTASGNVGNSGLEASYNAVLNGTDGREYSYLDEMSTVEKMVKEAVDGKTLVTSVDLNLQSIVEKYILEFNKEHKNEARKGAGSQNTAVLVMRPGTGEILAMASYPNFDLNNPRDLTGHFSKKQISAMKPKDKIVELNRIWRNFCVSDTYEPGSTFKPFAMAAGLESGALKGSETFVCRGVLEVGGWPIKCNKHEGHGTQTLKQAIANSCNVAMMHIGAKIGPEDFVKYQRIFGFGEYTGIDLPGEGSTEDFLKDPETMGKTDLATNSFGQNFNTTMVQLAAGFCSLINGGNYYEPHVVKQIRDAGGNVIENKNPLLVKKTVSEETSRKIREFMLATVEEGTAKSAQVKGYDVGGKTGTAEKHPRNKGNNLVSFIGYAPQKNPEIMVYVVIDEPNVPDQANSGLAVRLAQKIMAEAFPYMDITKAETD